MKLKNIRFRQKLKNLFIKYIDAFSPLHGALSKNGGVLELCLSDLQKKTLNDVVYDISAKLNDKIAFITNKYEGQGIFCHDIIQEYPRLVELIDGSLVKIVKDYLGEDAVLDKICLFIIPLTKNYEEGKNTSDIWHHDSVGHRIKVFFPIELSNGDKSFHEYRRNSNFINVDSYLNPVNKDGERLDDSYNGFDVVRIPLMQGKGVMIDTHGVHRGIYSNFLGLRASIQLEFSVKIKAHLTGYIGPVDYCMPNKVFRTLRDLNVINEKLISNEKAASVRQKGRMLIGGERVSIRELIK